MAARQERVVSWRFGVSGMHPGMVRAIHTRLVRWAFARFYQEFAWSYDVVATVVSWGGWRGWSLAVAPYLRGCVLELGCGTGYLQRAIAGLPAVTGAIGVDRSRQMLALSRRKAPHARLVRGDASNLPFPEAAFDQVAATFPSEYIADPRTLAEVRRVLRPGGRLLVVLAAQLSGPPPYQALIRLAYRLSLLQPPAAGHTPGGSAPTLLAAMRSASFAVEDAWVPVMGGSVYLITAEAR